jgi:hypothetical protein
MHNVNLTLAGDKCLKIREICRFLASEFLERTVKRV